MSNFEELETHIFKWAEHNDHILAVVVIGSRSRSIQPADQYSDLDLIVFTSQPDKLVTDSTWLSEISNVWISYKSVTGQNHPEWFVLFQDGLKADFVIIETPSNIGLNDMLSETPYQDIYQLGIRVLFNRTNSENEIEIAKETKSGPYTSEKFQSLIDMILMKVVRTALLIRRGELWQSQNAMAQVRNQIMVLLTFHASVTGMSRAKIWYDGRFIHEWAEPWILAKLPDLFPGYSVEELTRSVDIVVNLMNSVALDIASALGCEYPTPGQQATISWIARV